MVKAHHKFFKKKRVLLIDDSQVILNATRLMFLQHGCNNELIHLAKDSRAALNLCGRHQYDFILLDYNLGQGRDGLQLLEELNQYKLLGEHTVIYIVTAEQSRAVFHSFSMLNTDGYIIKPVRIGDIAERLVKSYKKKQQRLTLHSTAKNQGLSEAKFYCEQYSSNTSLLNELAGLYMQQGQFDSAKKMLVQNIKAGDHQARLLLAELMLEKEEYNLALHLVNNFVSEKRYEVRALHVEAQCYFQLKRFRAAFKTFHKLNRLCVNNILFLQQQYNLAYLLGEFEELVRLALKISAQITNSIWQDIDLYYLPVQAYLLSAEHSADEVGKKKFIFQAERHMKSIFGFFSAKQCNSYQMIVDLQVVLLQDNQSLRASLIKQLQVTEVNQGFYINLDYKKLCIKLNITAEYSEFCTLSQSLHLSQACLQRFALNNTETFEQMLQKKQKQAIFLETRGEVTKALKLWLEISRAQPNSVDIALRLVRAMAHVLPKGKPSDELRDRFEASRTIVDNNNISLPSWYQPACNSIEQAFNHA